MKEFMPLIRNEIDHQSGWPAENHREFLEGCEACIARPRRGGRGT